jgi:hypothetical protein
VKETVHVLAIEHRHGTDISVHRTETGARLALYDYVAENWALEIPKRKIPAKPGKAIARYFEEMAGGCGEGESYILESREVED